MAFLVVGFVVLLASGNVHIDPRSAMALFAIGGGPALIVLTNCNKRAMSDRESDSLKPAPGIPLPPGN
jgi:hypothetical protein